jgi:hypothetical protein
VRYLWTFESYKPPLRSTAFQLNVSVKIEMDLIMAWYLGAERKKSKKETEEIL